MRAPVVPTVRTLFCPNCGGTVELRGAGQALNAVCIQCLSILDASTPSLRLLQQFSAKQRYTPLILLGKRGRIAGALYEAIGFQVRQIVVDGVPYRWSEYLLYNPYKGYLYLTEYEGHWNVIRTLHALPEKTTQRGKPAVRVAGVVYRHFQSATASTIFVMGEFPWQVRYGDRVQTDDYIAAPQMVSSETTAEEITWSSGTYTPGSELWKAFELLGTAPKPRGVYSNQPSPYNGKVGTVWQGFGTLLLLTLAAILIVYAMSPNERAFQERYNFKSGDRAEASFVTPIFEFKGKPAGADIAINTNLNNDWAVFQIALINDDTGVAYNASKEISFYSGRDSDGNWTEGGRSAHVRMPVVPPGRYYLRVEPEMEEDGRPHSVAYDLTVRYGAPAFGWFVPVLVLILIPPIFVSVRAFRFENARWAESDYGAILSSSGEGD